jgi:hypothetical protein
VRDANLALVESIPAYDDDNYILDAEGNRILIGLTAEETREFERLDDLMSYANFAPTDDSQSLNERSWLVLYDQHQAAASNYISAENAKALRLLRESEQSESDKFNSVFQLNDIKLSRVACRRADGLPAIGVAKTVGVGVGCWWHRGRRRCGWRSR